MTQDLALQTGSPLTSLPEELQLKILAAAKKIQESSATTINRIRLDVKSYTFPDQNEVQSFQGIIIASTHANIHYQGEYEDGVSNPVDCMAVGSEACSALKPHSSVEKPFAENCAVCPNFQWGSASRGKGKSCGEHTLLAVYVPSYGDDILLLEEKKKNSVTADGYLKKITKQYGHPIAVTTQFTIGDNVKWEQDFVAVNSVAPELVVNLSKRIEEAEDMLVARVVDAYKPAELISTSTDNNSSLNARASRSR